MLSALNSKLKWKLLGSAVGSYAFSKYTDIYIEVINNNNSMRVAQSIPVLALQGTASAYRFGGATESITYALFAQIGISNSAITGVNAWANGAVLSNIGIKVYAR